MTRTHDDMENLLESTEIATVFLDSDLNIRQTTPAADRLLNTRPEDQDLPIAHFASPFRKVNLLTEAERVLARQEAVELEITTHAGRWYARRVMPYAPAMGMSTGWC